MSERWVPSSLPYFLLLPERESEPMSRMFCALTTSGVGRSFSYARSSSAAVRSVLMFASSLS